jgi:hypothetical protein
MCATVESLGWQIITVSGRALDKRPVQPSRVWCGSAEVSTLPLTVAATPASVWSASTGRISGGRVKSQRPIPRMTSWMMPV